jgi:hypothetical protein
MMNAPQESNTYGQPGEAICALLDVVSDGLRHGFFDINLTCEMVRYGKRVFTIHAGKTYRFTIPENQIHLLKRVRLLGLERHDEN